MARKIFEGKEIFKDNYTKHLETQIKYWQTIAFTQKERIEELTRENEELKEQIDFVKAQVEYPLRLAYNLIQEVTYGEVEDDE